MRRVIQNEAGYVELARDGNGVETAARPEADLRRIDINRQVNQILHDRRFHSSIFSFYVTTGARVQEVLLDRRFAIASALPMETE